MLMQARVATARSRASTAVGGAFSATYKAAGLTLSNAGKTVTNGAASTFGVVLGDTAVTGGKVWSLTVDNSPSTTDGKAIGLATTAVSLSNYLGAQSAAIDYAPNGTVRQSGSNLATGLDTWGGAGDVVYMETSADNTQVRFRKGAGAWSSWITHGLSSPFYVATYLYFDTHAVTGDFT